jgi:LysR family transcriptional regulator, regulator for bpeEF and oprC
MDLIQGMRVFQSVVDEGSFVRAADRLDLSKSVVTAHVADLEKRLSVRLLNRTTRRLTLTDDGSAYLEHCRRILADIDETHATLARGRAVPRGRLRVDAPTALGERWLMPAIPRLLEQYPELEVVLTLNDQVVDLIAERVDVALRVGALGDSSFVARRIYEGPILLCASPGYLERFDAPATPQALAEHRCLGLYFSTLGRVQPWVFERDGERHVIEPTSRFAVSAPDALVQAAVAGAGLVYISELVVGRQLASGQLVQLLPEWTRTTSLPLSVVYPHNRHLSAKVRAFVDFVAGLFPRPRARAAPAA